MMAMLELGETERRVEGAPDEVTFSSTSAVQLRCKIASCSELLDGGGVVELIRWFDENRVVGAADIERRCSSNRPRETSPFAKCHKRLRE